VKKRFGKKEYPIIQSWFFLKRWRNLNVNFDGKSRNENKEWKKSFFETAEMNKMRRRMHFRHILVFQNF